MGKNRGGNQLCACASNLMMIDIQRRTVLQKSGEKNVCGHFSICVRTVYTDLYDNMTIFL